MARVAGSTFPVRKDGVENAVGWETPGTQRGRETFLSCLVSLSLSPSIWKASFLPALNFCGSVGHLAEHRERGRMEDADKGS